MLKLVLKYTTDLVKTNTEIEMSLNVKIIKMNLCYCVDSFPLSLIHQKKNPNQYPDDGNNFTKDHSDTRIVLMHAKRD
jgi:hypothetical protein